jgi:hypothetical protein
VQLQTAALGQGCGGREGEDSGLLERPGGTYCYACLSDLVPAACEDTAAEVGVVVACPNCRRLFCFDCDAYIHEALHNCPGCLCEAEDENQNGDCAQKPDATAVAAAAAPMDVG